MIHAGKLNRRVQFRRAVDIDDGLSTRPGEYGDHGATVWASREDVSDSERAGADGVFAEVAARFVVRSSELTRGLTARDRLIEGGREFHIIGIKEVGRRDAIEITATTSLDR